MNFDLFVKDIEENDWNVFGVEVYENGKLKYNYGDTEGLHQIYSATKTVLSVAVGMAYDEKRIDIDKSILEYLPEDKYKNLSKKSYDVFSRITIRRLLTMSVDGFPFRAEGDNWLDFALNCDEIDPDKVTFNYSNISAYLVGVALDKAFGCDLGKVIEERILKPMDIVDYEYERSPEGYFYGASKMLLSVHDLSKFGLLLFNKGIYNGKRIISSEYVDLATSTQQMNSRYKYLFMRKGDTATFAARIGSGKASLNVFEGNNVIAVRGGKKALAKYLSHTQQSKLQESYIQSYVTLGLWVLFMIPAFILEVFALLMLLLPLFDNIRG